MVSQKGWDGRDTRDRHTVDFSAAPAQQRKLLNYRRHADHVGSIGDHGPDSASFCEWRVSSTFDLDMRPDACDLAFDFEGETSYNGKRQKQRRNTDRHAADGDIQDKSEKPASLLLPFGSAQVA